jgi:ParB family chromosome partitioning protein
MKLRQVEQALALGDLSPAIRAAWRGNEIKAEVARAFTLASDHKTQDRLLETLKASCVEEDMRLIELGADDVKEEMDIGDGSSGLLVEFVGIEAFVKRGGKVTRDLFGSDHKVSNDKLAVKMADERLQAECENLVRLGWSFAVPETSVRNKMHEYGNLKVTSEPTEEEVDQLAKLEHIFQSDKRPHWRHIDFFGLSLPQQDAYLQHRHLAQQIEVRAFTPELMTKAGCFVSIDNNGHLKVIYGKVKPESKKAAAKAVAAEASKPAKAGTANAASSAAKPAPEPTDISNALRDRLLSQLTHGTRDAIVAALETDLLKSDLAQTFAKIVCAQILPDRPIGMVDAVRTKMHAIREALPANLINSAILKRFDAADYFGAAPKSIVLKAITEAINADEARKVSGKTKAEIGKFAIANVGNKIGWVPKEMRTPQYVGPKPTPTAAKAKATPAKKAAAKKAVKAKSPAKAKPAAKKTAKKKA